MSNPHKKRIDFPPDLRIWGGAARSYKTRSVSNFAKLVSGYPNDLAADQLLVS
jgi:hypothetical protein